MKSEFARCQSRFLQLLRLAVVSVLAVAGPTTALLGQTARQIVAPSTATAALALDATGINGASTAIVIVSHVFTAGGYVPDPLWVSYSTPANKWFLRRQDGQVIPASAKFNVLAAPPGSEAFIHNTTGGASHVSVIDHPTLNGQPNARVFVTQRNNGVANLHPVGVYYVTGSSKWAIFNQDSAAMPAGAQFHVVVDNRGFIAEAAAPTAPTGNNFGIDHPLTNDEPNALVFSTPLWTGVYNPHSIGLWYFVNNWRIYNEDLAAMPANAKFHVLPLVAGDNTVRLPVTPRASVYDGVETGVSYPYESRLNRQVAITLEAWIYRAGEVDCATIISNSYQGGTGSYWFGLCPNLRFYRSGGTFADSPTAIPYRKWSHVAASYDGTTVRFYVNGVAAGSSPLANAGTGGNHPVMLGRDPAGYPFYGSLDEVRLWNGARSQAQIQASLWTEVRDDATLAAVWDTGGEYEVMGGVTGAANPVLPDVSGLGILPRELRVPRIASLTPVVDGAIDAATEYVGAERFAMLMPDGDDDQGGYLIHDGSRLYVAVPNLAIPTGQTTAQSSVSLYFDVNNQGGSAPTAKHHLAVLQTLDGVVSHSVGNLSGNYTIVANRPDWNVTIGPSIQEFWGPNMEFSIPFSDTGLGQWQDATDRFAMVARRVRTSSDTYPTPGNANAFIPDTWPTMTYSPDAAGARLPTASYNGQVLDAATGGPLVGRSITLRTSSGTVYGVTTTNSGGYFSMTRTVPTLPLTVQVATATGELAESPSVTNNNTGPSPTIQNNYTADYPICTETGCNYDSVIFRVRLPAGATSVSASSQPVFPQTVVRGGPTPKIYPASSITLTGANFHPYLDFYLALQINTLASPTSSSGYLTDLTEGTHYWPASVTSTTPTEVVLTCPDIPIAQRNRTFTIVMRDRWSRPANSPPRWLLGEGGSAVFVGTLPFELIHGFEFENIPDGHTIDDYRAVFPGEVCNPFTMVGFWVFFPIYLDVLGGKGECYGMSIAAQQYGRGLSAAEYGGDVIFANGFRTAPWVWTSEEIFNGPIRPATFNVSNPCAPDATNVLGRIRVYHGMQLSSESIGATLGQFEIVTDPLPSIITNMGDAINLMAPNPLRYHLCIRMGDKGHCVQPLRIITEVRDGGGVIQPHLRQIEIYDPNHPQTRRVIQINLTTNTYTYDGFSSLWSGRWMPIYETTPLITGGRHVPSIDNLTTAITRLGVPGLFDLLQILVSGDAEPMITDAVGGKTGWDATGTFVETSAETYPLPIFNWSDDVVPALGHHPVPMYHRMTAGPPQVSIRGRGASYKIHGSHHGHVFQYFVDDAVDGQSDQLAAVHDGPLVTGLRFAAGEGTRRVKAVLLPCVELSQYPAGFELVGLNVPAGQAVSLNVAADSAGFVFTNETSLLQGATARMILPNGASTEPEFVPFTLPSVPPQTSIAVRRSTPDFRQLLIEIDLGRDGIADSLRSHNTATGVSTETINPVLRMQQAGADFELSWLANPDWKLTTSPDLNQWTDAPPVSTSAGVSRLTVTPQAGSPQFYRLERIGGVKP